MSALTGEMVLEIETSTRLIDHECLWEMYTEVNTVLGNAFIFKLQR
jgi:hypothetical protein